MHTIVFSAQKGGCGKTTLALHLAVEYARSGLTVAVLDTDPQKSAALWGELREARDLTVLPIAADEIGAALRDAEADGYDLAIVDTPPHASAKLLLALRRADLAIIPFRPSPLDLATLEAVAGMVNHAGIPAVAILSAAPLRAAEIEPMRHALEAGGLRVLETIIHDLMPFRRSIGNGQSVTEFDPKGRAAMEIRSLRRELNNFITPIRKEVTTP